MSPTSSRTGILNQIRAWCDSWVMLDEQKRFVPLPGERILFTSPPRTTLALQTPNSYPGKEPLAIHSSGGVAFLTDQRVVYLPTTPTPQLQSFSAPVLNLEDTYVSAPFFGPNVWAGILKPVSGGGIPPQHAYVEIKMIFKDGGAFDFHSNFEHVKETLHYAVEEARESGRMASNARNTDLSGLHLEQLPAYEEVGGSTAARPPQIQRPVAVAPNAIVQPPSTELSYMPAGGQSRSGPQEQFPIPDEPPPGYEEAQQSSLVNHLEESARTLKS